MTPPKNPFDQTLPPGTPENFAWFASWISEQFGKLDGKLDSLSREFITRREMDELKNDINRAHQKVRELEQGALDELEERVRTIETQRAAEGGASKAHWTAGEKLAGFIMVVVQIGITIWLGTRTIG